MPLTTYTAGEVLTAASLNANFSFAALGGKLGQVVSTIKTDTFTSSSVSFTDITGLSVSITPSSATSKVLVVAFVSGSSEVGLANMNLRLLRASTAIAVGDAAGVRIQATASINSSDASTQNASTMQFLDSPATTSATTYKVQGQTNANSFYINRSDSDTDNLYVNRTVSTITVMEILA